MTQEPDSIKTDMAPHAENKAPPEQDGTAPSFFQHKYVMFIGRACKYLARKLYDVIGELVSVVCAIAAVWLFAISTLLTQQSVDVTRFKPEAQRWFAKAFDGNNADIGVMSLRWLPATDSVEMNLDDISVYGDDGQLVQNYANIKTIFPLKSMIAAQPAPSQIVIRGGSLSWAESEKGVVVAGLGTPETVGRLGPVFRGKLHATGAAGEYNFDNIRTILEGFESLKVQDTVLHYSNKHNGSEAVLDLKDMSVLQDGAKLDLVMSGSIRQDASASAPLDITLTTDTEFSRFDGSVQTQGARPNLIAPRKGRYAFLSDLSAPVDLDVKSIFSREKGLQASRIDLNVNKGALSVDNKTYPFESAQFSAGLEPGQQKMTIHKIALSSPRLRFQGGGTLTELGALSDGDINSSPVFDLQLSHSEIDATPTFVAPLTFKSVQAAGQIDFDALRLSLPKLNVQMGAELTGTAFDLTFDAQQNKDTGKLESLLASGNMTGTLSPQNLLKLWPVKAADGARRWVDGAMQHAVIERLIFKLNLDPAFFEAPKFTEDYVNVELDIREGRVKFMRAMPALENVVAKGRIIGNRIEADILSGTIDALRIESGRVQIPNIIPSGGDLIVDAVGTGQAVDMMRLLDNEPFKLAEKYDVEPAEFGGTGRINLNVTRPLRVNFDRNLIQYSAKGNFTEAVLPFEVFGQAISGGEIELEVDKTNMKLSGPVKIGPWPVAIQWQQFFGENAPPTEYKINGRLGQDMLDNFGISARTFFDGTVDLEITGEGNGLDVSSARLTADLTNSQISVLKIWSKSIGQPGQLKATLARGAGGSIILPQLDLTAPGLEILGELEIAQNLQLKVLDFSKMRIDGLLDAAVQLKPDANNSRFSLFVEGDYLDISPWTDTALSTRSSAGLDVPVIMTAAIDRLYLRNEYALSDAKFLFTHTGVSLSSLRLGGNTVDGPVTAELVTSPDDATRMVTLEIPDASKAVMAFLGISGTKGGQLEINAKLPPIDRDGAIIGNAQIRKFKLQRAPFLAKILSLASLTGLVDTLGGDGLAFDKFEVPFSFQDDLLRVRRARVYGPALGMTGNGDIQLETRALDFDGTVVPAYSANTIFNDIPVLGSLIGRKGEGVFALTYAVQGPFEKVQISVNPLSALTPGFLRRIFQPKRDKLPDEVIAQIEDVRPDTEPDK